MPVTSRVRSLVRSRSRWRYLVWSCLLAVVVAIAWRSLDLHFGASIPELSGAPAELFGSEAFVLEHRQLVGEVTQVEPAGSYTYFEIVQASGETSWVVAMGRGHRQAKHLEVTSFGHRNQFRSRRLGRTFEQLHFVTITESSES